jgi:nitrogen fixation-related uncharacterized protein
MRQVPNSSFARGPTWWIARLFGAVTVLVLLAILAALVVLGWFFWSLSSKQRENEEWGLAKMRQQASQIEGNLRVVAAGGRLTDAEIDRAAQRQPWHVERGPGQIQIVVRMISTTGATPLCFTYTLTEPLDSQRVIRLDEERRMCPEAVYHFELHN